jgi:hypothetical protein
LTFRDISSIMKIAKSESNIYPQVANAGVRWLFDGLNLLHQLGALLTSQQAEA